MREDLLEKNDIFYKVFGVLLIFSYIFVYKNIPLQDYPDWIYQGFLLKEIISGKSIPTVELVGNIPPNISSALFIALFGYILGVYYAAKLYLFLSIVVLFYAITKWMEFFGKKLLINYFIALILAFNFNFFHGNINFVLGIGLSLLFLVFMMKNQRFDWLFLFMNIILYTVHFIPYVLFNFYLFTFYLYKKDFTILTKMVLYNIPTGVIFLHYFFTKDSWVDHETVFCSSMPIEFIVGKAYRVFSYLKPIPLMIGIHDEEKLKLFLHYFNDVVSLLYGFGFVYYLFFSLKKKIKNFHFYFVAFLTFIFMLLPCAFGGVSAPAERLILFITVIILSELIRLHGITKGHSTIKIAIFVIFFVQFLYVNYMTYDFNNKYSNVLESQSNGRGSHKVFARKVFYKAIEKKDYSLNFFSTGILKKKNDSHE